MHTLIGRGVIAGLLFSLLSICSGKSWAYNIWYWEDWASTAGCYTHQTYLGCVAQCGPSDDKAERRVIKHPDPAVDPSHDRDWVCQIKSRPLYCPPPYTLDMRELMPNYSRLLVAHIVQRVIRGMRQRKNAGHLKLQLLAQRPVTTRSILSPGKNIGENL